MADHGVRERALVARSAGHPIYLVAYIELVYVLPDGVDDTRDVTVKDRRKVGGKAG